MKNEQTTDFPGDVKRAAPKPTVGDVVHIKSGSPKMTISRIARSRAKVVYCSYNSGVISEVWVPLNVLARTNV